MKTEFKRSINGGCLILEAEEFYKEDYQLKMIAANDIDGILSVKAQGMDGKSRYYYGVKGKKCMKKMYGNEKIGYQELKLFLKHFLKTTKAVNEYMLNENRIILDPKYIFFEKQQFYFCYYPPGKRVIGEEFHRLSEYLVRQVDYEDEKARQIVFELHKQSMEEYYNVEQLINEIIKESEEQSKEVIIEEYTNEKEEEEVFLQNIEIPRGRKENHRKVNRKARWGEWGDLP